MGPKFYLAPQFLMGDPCKVPSILYVQQLKIIALVRYKD